MDKKAVICMPTDRSLTPEVADSFAGVYGRGLVDGTVTAKLLLADTFIDQARNLLVTYALDVPTKPTHIFWMDSDMIVGTDTVARLMARDKPIVGGLYHQRVPPFHPVAYVHHDERRVRFVDLGEDDPSGLVKVAGMGLGCCLVEIQVYLDMADRFDDVRWHRVEEGVGEDVTFFRRVEEMGIEVFLDCDVRAGHVRTETVTTLHHRSYRRAHPTLFEGSPVASAPTV